MYLCYYFFAGVLVLLPQLEAYHKQYDIEKRKIELLAIINDIEVEVDSFLHLSSVIPEMMTRSQKNNHIQLMNNYKSELDEIKYEIMRFPSRMRSSLLFRIRKVNAKLIRAIRILRGR